ncbi:MULTISPECIES: hypothetical protein [Vibrio]|nr:MULTISPECIES: hypothetical protein [Vibrio]EGQ8109708.1 hypothetical protein [Vibrio parahaemolyticus]EGQ8546837.1 hypothetical protein [Vibrio parahaemolyticus]EGQ9070635.1 hypothetical protein [Vibrio parahaemolyticus]EGQ9132868.1 hypothetical protein [Vibrio parahaemolyticus]EGR3388475.1 hypothetical protein [Vibrio parahaemolyticus]
MRISLTILTLALSPNVLAGDMGKFRYYESQNGLTNTTSYIATSIMGAKLGSYDPIENIWSYHCAKSNDDNTKRLFFKLTFPKAVATPNDKLVVKLRFRNNKQENSELYTLQAKMFSNSYESAFITDFSPKFIEDASSYKSLLFSVTNSTGQSSGQYIVSNKGFKAAYNKVMGSCS